MTLNGKVRAGFVVPDQTRQNAHKARRKAGFFIARTALRVERDRIVAWHLGVSL